MHVRVVLQVGQDGGDAGQDAAAGGHFGLALVELIHVGDGKFVELG